jgi:hypothetical protein
MFIVEAPDEAVCVGGTEGLGLFSKARTVLVNEMSCFSTERDTWTQRTA